VTRMQEIIQQEGHLRQRRPRKARRARKARKYKSR
jgi:hypothetical protein